MRLALPIAILILLACSVSGCGAIAGVVGHVLVAIG